MVYFNQESEKVFDSTVYENVFSMSRLFWIVYALINLLYLLHENI